MTKTELKWSLRVSAWRASGQSGPEFAEGRGFRVTALRNWAHTLKKRGLDGEEALQAVASPMRLARVERSLVGGCPSSMTVEIGEARASVPAGFDETTVRVVLDALLAHAAARGGQ